MKDHFDPNNPQGDSPSRKEKIKAFLAGFCQPVDKFRHNEINSKYLFSKDLYDKIMKLKDIFIEFDEDYSSNDVIRKTRN